MSRAKCFDCSGLIVYYLIKMGLLKYDTTADGIWKKCKEKKLSKVKKGDFVFKVNSSGTATHIGCVVDDNKSVVEAYGRDKGVIIATIGKGSNWNKAGVFNG
jgi:cell wall-associated NlpC family hydrolase